MKTRIAVRWVLGVVVCAGSVALPMCGGAPKIEIGVSGAGGEIEDAGTDTARGAPEDVHDSGIEDASSTESGTCDGTLPAQDSGAVAGCDDGKPCTDDVFTKLDSGDCGCAHPVSANGTPCLGGLGACVSGACIYP